MIRRLHTLALPPWVRLLAGLALLSGLAACGSRPAQHARSHYNPSRYYPPPGPSDDPWGPYIREASARFTFPEPWIRRVMRQESGGQQDVISWAGAMGLMQVMPDTYDGLKGRYNLGDDPFDPHNNILAGTAYLREMYDRFGAPGFLAAYNAGPTRLDSYLNNGRPLPAETVNYVASITPLLGSGVEMSGPLAVYAGSRGYAPQLAARPTPYGCDPDAAYNPDGPCTPRQPEIAQPVAVASVSAPPVIAEPLAQPAPPVVPFAYASIRRPWQESMAQRVAYTTAAPSPGPSPGPAPGPPPGHWAIQVGAFAHLATAQAAAENARAAEPALLGTASTVLPATAPFGGKPAFRARLAGLSPAAAADACSRLSGRGMACMTVPPERSAF